MRKINEIWKKNPLFNRIACICVLILSTIVVILSVLRLQNKLSSSFLSFFTTAILGIISLLNGLLIRKINPKTGTVLLGISVLIFICAFLILLIKVL